MTFGPTNGEKIAAAAAIVGPLVTATRTIVVLGMAAVYAVAAHHWPVETFAFMASIGIGKLK